MKCKATFADDTKVMQIKSIWLDESFLFISIQYFYMDNKYIDNLNVTKKNLVLIRTLAVWIWREKRCLQFQDPVMIAVQLL